MLELFNWELILRLLLAAVLGGLIGWERERIQRPAGLRTNMLVALGSALFTVISFTAFGEQADPSRIAAQIVTGIGVLGAGTIIHTRQWVLGMTTAAGLWTVAAIGMACGAGYYGLSVAATAIALAILLGLRLIEARSTGNSQAE